MSVRYRFTIEINWFTHSLCTCLACAAYDVRSRSIEDLKGRRRQQNESRCMKDGSLITAQQNDKRRQDDGDKKRLAHQHWSDLLHSLIHEQTEDSTASSRQRFELRTFHLLCMRHMMRMRIQVDTTSCEYLYQYRYGQYDS